MTTYKWTRKHYTRNTPRGKWIELKEQEETETITGEKMEQLTSPSEVRFFRGLGAYVRVERYYNGIVTFKNISPSKLEKTEEKFEPSYLLK